jgi:predicted PurR-regulated permease PerM
MKDRDVTIHITSGSVVKTILFLILFATLWYLRDIVLIVVTAVVIASAIEPGIRSMKRFLRAPRLLAVILMYLIVAVAFCSILFIFVPPILSDAAGFISQLPTTLLTLNVSDVTHGLLPWSSLNALSSADLLRSFSSTLSDSTGGVFSTLSAFFGGITSLVLVIVFSFYFSVQETGVDDFLRIITPIENEVYVLDLWKRSQDKIGKWMQGQLLLGCLVAVLIFLLLTIVGLKHALFLAIIAGSFGLIPVFGQILAAIPGVAIAFSVGGIPEAVIVAIIYTVVQQFEAHLVYPLVVKKVVGVPPILVILALLIGFQLFGFLGVLLSVPIAAAVQEFVNDVDKRKREKLPPEAVDA